MEPLSQEEKNRVFLENHMAIITVYQDFKHLVNRYLTHQISGDEFQTEYFMMRNKYVEMGESDNLKQAENEWDRAFHQKFPMKDDENIKEKYGEAADQEYFDGFYRVMYLADYPPEGKAFNIINHETNRSLSNMFITLDSYCSDPELLDEDDFNDEQLYNEISAIVKDLFSFELIIDKIHKNSNQTFA